MLATNIEPDRILELGYAFRKAKVLLSAIELELFTTLADGPLDCDALQDRVGIDRRGARDFFDALVALGLLERDDAGRYSNTTETQCYLDARKPSYIGGDLAHLNERMYQSWNGLTAALRTGKPQNGLAGADYFPTLYANQVALNAFVRGTTGGSLLAASASPRRFLGATVRPSSISGPPRAVCRSRSRAPTTIFAAAASIFRRSARISRTMRESTASANGCHFMLATFCRLRCPALTCS